MNALFVVRFNQFRPVLELLLQTIYCKYCNHHAIYLICLSVCLFVLKNNTSKFAKFSVHVTLGRGVVLLWQQCTSGFVDDAMFSHRANGLESKTTHVSSRWSGWRHRVDVCRLRLHLVKKYIRWEVDTFSK